MKFKDEMGNEKVKELLRKSIRKNRISSSYLFFGPQGSGKTATAYAFVQSIFCDNFISQNDACDECKYCRLIKKREYPDFYVISPGSSTKESKTKSIKIGQIRQLQNNLNLKSYYPKKKVVIVESAEMMNLNAQNAFLKSLEEPPGDTVIILITNNINMLLPTIISRCQKTAFVKPGITELKSWLEDRLGDIPPAEREGIISKYIEYSDSNPRYLFFFKSAQNFLSFADKVFKHLLDILKSDGNPINLALENYTLNNFFTKSFDATPDEKINIFFDIITIFFVEILKGRYFEGMGNDKFKFGEELIRNIKNEEIITLIEYIDRLRYLVRRNVNEDLILINLNNRIGELNV